MAKNKTTAEELVSNANSKAPLPNFTSSEWAPSIVPDYSFDKVLELIDADPVASGAINHFVDKFIEGGWAVIKRTDGTYEKEFEKVLRYQHYFDSAILKRIALMGKLFNNVFLEVVRNEDGSLKDLNILDTTQVEAVTKSNGDLIRLKSKTSDPVTGEYAIWDRNDIIWFKFGDRTGGYAHVDARALWTTLLAKGFVQRFVSWLWQTGQYRVVHNFNTTDQKVVKDFIAMNKKSERSYQKPFLSSGEYSHSVLRDMKETESLVELLKYYDSQILILLRIPPIDAGIPDASGRSNADAQSNNLSAHIRSFKKTVTDGINQLFKRINKGNTAFVFAPNDRFEFKMVLENVQIMKSVGMKDEVIQEYLTDNGVVFEQQTMFNPIVEEEVNNPRDLDMYESRKGKSDGEANQKIGTGNEATTREDQLVKNSVSDSYEYSEQWREY